MKILPSLLLGMCLALVARAQDENASVAPVPTNADSSAVQRTPEMLDTLLGPIALYPDALVALMLPAATAPTDIVLASRYMDSKGDLAAVDAQPWSDSVKALVHYPDVLKWMDDNLPWTQSLGQAFLDQPADVMNAVQRLRLRARASGALVDTPQQHVVTQDNTVVIVPAQPDIVYVPIYDPTVVYLQRTVWVNRPIITFGFGYQIGSWFIYDCDWGQSTVWVVSRPSNWQNQPQYWRHNVVYSQKPPGKPWHPSTNYKPRSNTQVYSHTPTPRPIRLDPKTSPTNSPQRPSVTPHPQGSPGMRPSSPNRTPRIPRDREELLAPAKPVLTPLPPLTPIIVPRPGFVKPPVITSPSPSFKSSPPIDRSHHQVAPSPAAPTANTDPATLDPKKNRP